MDERVKHLRTLLRDIDRISAALADEFGSDPGDPCEMGYALTHGARELRQELSRRTDRYNPFHSDSRRK